MQRTQSLLEGLFAGALSGLLIAVMLFVNYGPGNELALLARWVGLDVAPLAKLLGFILVVGSCAIFGLLFGLIMGNRSFDFPRLVLAGLVTGLVWWLLFPFLFSIIRQNNSLYVLLLFLALGLLYGLVLSNIYWYRTSEQTESRDAL